MSRSRVLTVAFLIALTACTETAVSSRTTEAAVPSSTTQVAVSSSTSELPADPGRLVVVDGSGDIVVISADGTGQTVVAEAQGSVFTQPVWSPDGESLAWGQIAPGGFSLAVAEVGAAEPSMIPMSNLPFFSYWSPDGSHIGVLHNGTDGIDFEMVEVATASSSVLGQGTPFYFSWSPASDEVIAHTQARGFEIIDLGGVRTSLGDTDPGYLAPQWTEDGIFHVVDEQLVLRDPAGQRKTVGKVNEFALFVANTQATRVAVQSGGDGSGLTVGLRDVQAASSGIRIFDLETGDSEVVGDNPALGFFWSPDGESLMILELAGSGLAVSVWTAGSGTEKYGVFRPSQVVVETMLPFFPQYAQSVSFWSPDSSAFSYAADNGIWIQELGEPEPVKVWEGSWVAWSP